MKLAAALLLAALLAGCGHLTQAPNANANSPFDDHPELRAAMRKVEPYFAPMDKPERYDWLGAYREPGQTFDEYLESKPARPTDQRRTIYFLPLGNFTQQQQRILAITAGYLEAFYYLPVKKMAARKLLMPVGASDRRRTVGSKSEQVRTGYIMDSLLKPILPDDAAALIAFTNVDLFPGSSMNFVFGQASRRDRVGVWSVYRLDDNANDPTFLRRVLKIATHETGHMFAFAHCTKYECVMSGTNHLAETDRRPIDACPECTAKVCWLTEGSPAARYRRLAEFCLRHGLDSEAEDFQKKLDAVN